MLNFVHFYSEIYINVHTYMQFFICDRCVRGRSDIVQFN